jgi:hypothetical protein
MQRGGADFQESVELALADAVGEGEALVGVAAGLGGDDLEDILRRRLRAGEFVEHVPAVLFLSRGGDRLGGLAGAVDDGDLAVGSVRLLAHEADPDEAAAEHQWRHDQADQERLGADGREVIALGDEEDSMHGRPPRPPGRRCG